MLIIWRLFKMRYIPLLSLFAHFFEYNAYTYRQSNHDRELVPIRPFSPSTLGKCPKDVVGGLFSTDKGLNLTR